MNNSLSQEDKLKRAESYLHQQVNPLLELLL